MARYFFHLSERYYLPVLPVVVFLRVGLDGISELTHTIRFGRLDTLVFRCLYVGLPALDAVEYLEGDNDLGAALAGLMRIQREERVRILVNGLRRIANAERNEYERYLLVDCLERYLSLETPADQTEFDRLIEMQDYEVVKMLAITTFEKGLEQGLEKGIEKGLHKGQREMVVIALEERFGPVSESVKQKLDQLAPTEFPDLLRRILKGASLAELGQDD
jgi:hypothetical protein